MVVVRSQVLHILDDKFLLTKLSHLLQRRQETVRENVLEDPSLVSRGGAAISLEAGREEERVI